MAHNFQTKRLLLTTSLLCGVVFVCLLGPNALADQPPRPVSFVNDIVPVLTKAGCNAGVCHAKANTGQNGFQLSLLGFESKDDYQRLVLEGRGRRLFPAAPEKCLLLLKASGAVPHGGGVRLPTDSPGYSLLLNWIRQGAAYDADQAPALVAIDVQPSRATLLANTEQPLKAIARYSDGNERDVTDQALFESNDKSMAETTDSGVVKVSNIPGKVAVMVRYQGKVSVFNASIPLGASVDSVPPSKNFVDDFVFANLREIGIPPSPVCNDTTFLRRVSLDIAGRLPTQDEAKLFLASQEPNKRDEAIERLLRSPEYADYFANKWTAMLKNRRDDASDIISNFAFSPGSETVCWRTSPMTKWFASYWPQQEQ